MAVKKAKQFKTSYDEIAARAKPSKHLLEVPVVPFVPRPASLSNVLARMQDVSFQGRSLAQAFDALKNMIQDRVTIMLGLSGAMTPAGMGEILIYMIQNRYVDCLVSTGANLFHDVVNSLGGTHWKGAVEVDDMALREHFIDRIYDTFGDEREYHSVDEYVCDFACSLDPSRPMSSREFLHRLGGDLAKREKKPSILSAAYRAKVPVYCPSIADSSLGIALAFAQAKMGLKLQIDTIADVVETAAICGRSRGTGMLHLGGGVPKNFIQQAQVTAQWLGYGETAHAYAIQITQDSPVWGGLSGATFKEAQSWGKIKRDARMVQAFCDSTIALPLLISGLVDAKVRRKIYPRFNLDDREISITP